MARIIEFYIPARHKPKTKWVQSSECGKLIVFPARAA
jgi:hypothetical protein